MNLKSSARLLSFILLACLASACSTPGHPVREAISGPVRQVSCEATDTLKSVDSVGQIQLRFSNQAGTPLSLFWLNYNGEAEPYGTIAPGRDLTVNTYFSHPWLLRDAGERCVAAYVSSDLVDVRVSGTGRH